MFDPAPPQPPFLLIFLVFLPRRTVDPSIKCHTQKHEAILLYARLMVALYTAGVPLLLLLLLWTHRRAIEARTTRSGGAELSALAILFRPYFAEFW